MDNHNLSKKPLFNLSKVLQETGIKADTLRAWERRYQLPAPSRTEGGHRLFSAYDIETIRWLQARQDEGLRISQAVDYWHELIAAGTDPLLNQIQEPTVLQITPETLDTKLPLNSLLRMWIDSSLEYDEAGAMRALDQAFSQFPWEVVCSTLISQGLQEIGQRWYTGEISVPQEHFASEIVICKLQSLIAAAPPSYHPQSVLISNPPGEFHTIAPLMIDLLLRYRGWEVTYLGANVPDEQLTEAVNKIQPTLVIMTAARLTSSAALLKTSSYLLERGIPLAFGGTIFTDIPEMADRIPGHFLGTNIGQAISKIETLLSAPEMPKEQDPRPNPYQDLASKFKTSLPFLENQALLTISANQGSEFPLSVLQDANDYLFQDIQAALTLGDLNLLDHNLDWIKGMLDSRDYHPGEFQRYLGTFLTITEAEFGELARPLLEKFASFSDKLE